MEKQKSSRCPHYQLYAEQLDKDHGPNVIAIRRCMLSERLIALLDKTIGGDVLTQRLTIRTNSEKRFAVVGPDLEAVTQDSCTVFRCEGRCTPGYISNLEHFNATDPNLESVTCTDGEMQPDEAVKEAAAVAPTRTV